MLEPDHPWQQRFARFSLLETQHGLLQDSEDMLSATQWLGKLQESGLMIKGYRLRYREGVKRKRLPSKRQFAESQEAKPEAPLQSLESEPLDSDLHDCLAVESIDSDLEDQTAGPESRTAELPVRSRRFGIGKEIGYAVYVHRDYEQVLGEGVEWAKRHLPELYEYTVVKLNQRNDSVSFIFCPGFDAEHEPAIEAIVVVAADGSVQRRSVPSDPYIYHHKWLFVGDDYRGFDVEASVERSRKWIALGDVDRARIGRRGYWAEHVLGRIEDSEDEPWLRSAQVRKQLKLSTCELAHLRDAGRIEWKNVGNAFLYRPGSLRRDGG